MSTRFSRWCRAARWCGSIGLLVASPAAGQDAARAPAPSSTPRFVVPGAPESASAGTRADAATAGAPARRVKVRRRAKADAVVTYPGFRLLPDGKSRIFVELTQAVAVEERRTATSVVYTLRGASVPVRNNRNALVTTHFATAVARAKLVRRTNDVELVIELRAPVSPVHQVVSTDGGGARLEVDFPAGNYPTASGPARPGSRSGEATTSPADEEPAEGSTETTAPPP